MNKCGTISVIFLQSGNLPGIHAKIISVASLTSSDIFATGRLTTVLAFPPSLVVQNSLLFSAWKK
jgi:hypothetical protein